MPSDVSVRCLLASARYGSFTKAAEELYMTRQAVSQQIAALERELGAKLFDRTTAAWGNVRKSIWNIVRTSCSIPMRIGTTKRDGSISAS